MDQTQLSALVTKLVDAYRKPGTLIPTDGFEALTAQEAMAVQAGVLNALDETTPVSKVGKDGNGRGIVAPILGSRVVKGGETLSLPLAGFAGIEVEVAVRLKADITPEIAKAGDDAIAQCVEAYVLGIELVGSRFADRTKAGAYGPLADNMTGAGYAVGEAWPSAEIEGTPIVIDLDGVVIFSGPAKHPFGGVYPAIRNYAQDQFDLFGALKAGMVVTTGTLCGLLPISGPGTLTAKVGDSHQISLVLV
jgi:2-keto-4-pentenoate hydratase